MQRYYTVRQAAHLFQVSEKTVREWIRRGRLVAAKPGGSSWRIAEAELSRALDGRQSSKTGVSQ